jgi:hypothetical protein
MFPLLTGRNSPSSGLNMAEDSQSYSYCRWDRARLLHAASWLSNLNGIIHDLVNRRASRTIADADRPRHGIPLRYSVVSCFLLVHFSAVRR